MIVGVTVTVASSVRLTVPLALFGFLVRPTEVRYHQAWLRTSVPQ